MQSIRLVGITLKSEVNRFILTETVTEFFIPNVRTLNVAC